VQKCYILTLENLLLEASFLHKYLLQEGCLSHRQQPLLDLWGSSLIVTSNKGPFLMLEETAVDEKEYKSAQSLRSIRILQSARCTSATQHENSNAIRNNKELVQL
jgi:hypothetical protein